MVQLGWKASEESAWKLDASCGFFLTGFGWSGFGCPGQDAVRLPGGPVRLEGVGINVLGGWRPPAASS